MPASSMSVVEATLLAMTDTLHHPPMIVSTTDTETGVLLMPAGLLLLRGLLLQIAMVALVVALTGNMAAAPDMVDPHVLAPMTGPPEAAHETIEVPRLQHHPHARSCCCEILRIAASGIASEHMAPMIDKLNKLRAVRMASSSSCQRCSAMTGNLSPASTLKHLQLRLQLRSAFGGASGCSSHLCVTAARVPRIDHQQSSTQQSLIVL